MLIVRLLAAASMADDRIAFTNWAPPQHGVGAARRPIGLEQLVNCSMQTHSSMPFSLLYSPEPQQSQLLKQQF